MAEIFFLKRQEPNLTTQARCVLHLRDFQTVLRQVCICKIIVIGSLAADRHNCYSTTATISMTCAPTGSASITTDTNCTILSLLWATYSPFHIHHCTKHCQHPWHTLGEQTSSGWKSTGKRKKERAANTNSKKERHTGAFLALKLFCFDSQITSSALLPFMYLIGGFKCWWFVIVLSPTWGCQQAFDRYQ